MKADTISKLIVAYEDTHDPKVLAQIADRYCEYKVEEPIEWMEEMIDHSPESEAIYHVINQRYLDAGREHLRDGDKG